MSTPPTTTPWVPLWDLSGAVDLNYRGAYVTSTSYNDGDIVVYNGVAYVCVRPTMNPPGAWAAASGIPQPVVSGQWLKGSGGAVVWSAITSADVIDLGVYQAYTPMWACSTTAPVLGNGGLAGRYSRMGKLVHCNGSLSIGTTTTTGAGSFAIGLPTPAHGGYETFAGVVTGWRGGVGNYPTFVPRASPNAVYFEMLYPLTWPGGALGMVSGGNGPWGAAWANGDQLTWSFVYEAA